MKHTGILREFAKYTTLNVLGMLGLSCYILADTFFVSQGLGTNGLTALNLAIPVYSFLNGCGLMLGMGGANRYAIQKSRGEEQAASQTFTHTILLAVGFAVLFFSLGAGCSGAITRLLGADAAVFPMSKTYLQVILLFSPVFLLNNVLLCFVRNDGAPQRSMLAMLGGSLSNVVLDYVFIFPCGMGIFGAVLATGLAPVISILILSPYFIRGKNGFRLLKCRPSRAVIASIFSGGLPSLITEVSGGVVMIVYNSIILRLAGNVGVAAYGVIANLSLVVIAIYTGIAQGIQPLLSRSHGRGDAPRANRVLRYAMISMLLLSIGIYALMFFAAPQITAVFNSEQNRSLASIAMKGLRIYFSGCVFAGWNIILCVYFTATEYARPAHMVSFLRGFLLIIPMALLLAAVGGMTGIWAAFPVTELLSAGCGLVAFMALWRNRKHGRKVCIRDKVTP